MHALSRSRSMIVILSLLAASDAKAADGPQAESKMPWVSLLAAARSGEIDAEAQGTGDGRMAIQLANRTNRRLKVVLPPGLIAAGTTGQFAGIGGLGGLGAGGLGIGGQGIGGFGFGGQGIGGFGLGGPGIGGFGLGGQVGRVGFGGAGLPQTASPAAGLSMLGQSIMTSTGHPDSWNTTSLAQGGNPGMGAFGVMAANPVNPLQMMRGFRSVPPTDLPAAILEPGQSRPLATRLVSLKMPGIGAGIALPASGEKLRLGDIAELGASAKVQDVLRRLAREKAPETVAQLALWGAAGTRWDEVVQASRGWANAYELTLAASFLGRLDRGPTDDPGRLMVEVVARDADAKALAEEIRTALKDRTMLGLAIEPGLPPRPGGPAIGCTIRANGGSSEPEVTVEVTTSDARGVAWVATGKFTIPVARDGGGALDGQAFGESLSDGLIQKLIVATLKPAKTSKGKVKAGSGYTIRVENDSPLILNGLSLTGSAAKDSEAPKMLIGIGLSPGRSFTLPATEESVERLGMKPGLRITGLDLSGL